MDNFNFIKMKNKKLCSLFNSLKAECHATV